MECANCRKLEPTSHCANCNTPYCSRECQVGHWKQHKKTCKKSKDKREPERETLQPGMFRMNKSIHGTMISFGYEAKKISLSERNEFEEAVAAVENAGIDPPDLDEARDTSIRVAITSLDTPFLSTIYLQESSYGPDAPPEILRVQALATKMTGASHMFHLVMQKCGTALSPTMSCKCRGLPDVDNAITTLTQQYLTNVEGFKANDIRSPTQLWTNISCSQFLYLLEMCCGLEGHLLRAVATMQHRIKIEKNWEGKEEETKVLQAQVETSSFYKVGEDLFELLLELLKRSVFDSTNMLSVRNMDALFPALTSTDSKSSDDVGAGEAPTQFVAISAFDILSYVNEWLERLSTPSAGIVTAVALPVGPDGTDSPSATKATVPSFSVATGDGSVSKPLRTLSPWRLSTLARGSEEEPGARTMAKATAYFHAHVMFTGFLLDSGSGPRSVGHCKEAIEEAVALFIVSKQLSSPP